MEQKSNGALISAIVIIILLIIAGAYFLSNKTAPTGGLGRIIVGITDPAPDLGTISKVLVIVNKVELRSEEGGLPAQAGWITVSTATKDYDLIALKQADITSLYADATVPAGTYNQVRLDISKVVITDNGVAYDAKLPSGVLKINGNFIVKEGETSTVVFDFKADKSINVTGNGQYIFTPVINLESKSGAKVEINEKDEVEIENGKTETDEDFEMDEKGEIKTDNDGKKDDDLEKELNDIDVDDLDEDL